VLAEPVIDAHHGVAPGRKRQGRTVLLATHEPKAQSAGHPPLYLIFNLAIGGTWFGNVTSETDFSQWEMNLKSITIYSLPDRFNGDQELPLSTGGSGGP
jgi:hypothetical protein